MKSILCTASSLVLLCAATAEAQFTSATSPILSPGAAGVVRAGGTTVLAGPGARANWTKSTLRVMMASPKFADLDQDGVDEIVMVLGGPDSNPYGSGELNVWDGAGNDLPGFPVALASASWNTAAIGDLDHNGDLEIVVGTWSNLYVFNHDGTPHAGWPMSLGVSQPATLADLDGDGDLEIIVPSDSTMHVFHHDGSGYAGFPISVANLLTTAAVGDLEGDGDLEILAGSFLGPGSNTDNVWAWHHDGTTVAGFPVVTSGSVKSAPALADLDGDGTLEVLANCWNKNGTDFAYVWDHLGADEPGWPIQLPYIRLSSPSVADLDLDGDLEVIQGGWTGAYPYYEVVHANHHDAAPVLGFPVSLVNSPSGNVNSSLTTGDIDDDGEPEIVIKATNNMFALNADGSIVLGFPVSRDDASHSGTFSPTPAIGDPDGDGLLEIVHAASFDTIMSLDQTGPATPAALWWPTYQNDAGNRSVYDRQLGSYTAYCFGDPGSGTQCPCANDNDGSVPGSGCDNGYFASGAQLGGLGSASVSQDSLVLATSGLEPNNTGLYFQANNQINGGNGNLFGDGLRCAGGGLIRLEVRFADGAGYSQTSIGIASKGGVMAGDTKRYQCWYRTTVNPPCGLGVNDFNLSNGLEVIWVP